MRIADDVKDNLQICTSSDEEDGHQLMQSDEEDEDEDDEDDYRDWSDGISSDSG